MPIATWARRSYKITGYHRWRKDTTDLDGKLWVPNDDVEGRAESDEQQLDGIERFFDYLAYQF